MRCSLIAASLAAWAAVTTAVQVQAGCTALLPPAKISDGKRAITAADLIEMRDIGYPEAGIDAASPLGLSPDGRRIAFTIFRGDLATNGYCRGLAVMELTTGARPRLVDTGGEQPLLTLPARGTFANYGLPVIFTPAWSPDGQWIAYLRRDHDITQIWRASADGSGGEQISHLPSDAAKVVWTADGHGLIFSYRPDMAEAQLRINREGASGWLYDDRGWPGFGAKPQVYVRDVPLGSFVIDLLSGRVRTATPDEGARLQMQTEISAGASAFARNGSHAWIGPANNDLTADDVIWTGGGDLPSVKCEWASCLSGLRGVWWDNAGGAILFLRQEGWHKQDLALYRWTVGGSAPRKILSTTDAISSCMPAGRRLLCLRENSVTPRHVVVIDPHSGASEVLFDPNPEFHDIALGPVRRLKWRSDRGLEAWGDLVLPPDYQPGTRLPMIVVQYMSRGFLRGGTDNEYPVYLFAARGYAVLSVDRPSDVAVLTPGLTTIDQLNRAQFAGWADRWNVQSSLEQGVKAALATGAVDPAKIGITGLSDGGTAVRFAVINSRLFAAGALSSCCVEPVTALTVGGPAFAKSNLRMGFPELYQPGWADYWRPMSLAMNASHIDTPLLMQLSDDEYLLGLEAFEALREKGKPVEMYVFPDEHHGKWQPAHHLAIYGRTLDWFDFWLRGREDSDPAKQAQYARWRTLRSAAARVGADNPPSSGAP